MGARDIERLLYKQSGLLGVSGISSDMRALEASPDPRARLAIDLFVYRIGREIGSLAAALGGLDAIVFTAGIGEHSASLRRAVCRAAAWIGVTLDDEANVWRLADQHAGQPRFRLDRADRRGVDDRAPHQTRADATESGPDTGAIRVTVETLYPIVAAALTGRAEYRRPTRRRLAGQGTIQADFAAAARSLSASPTNIPSRPPADTSPIGSAIVTFACTRSRPGYCKRGPLAGSRVSVCCRMKRSNVHRPVN